jgi:hypothetical protein
MQLLPCSTRRTTEDLGAAVVLLSFFQVDLMFRVQFYLLAALVAVVSFQSANVHGESYNPFIWACVHIKLIGRGWEGGGMLPVLAMAPWPYPYI